MNAHRTTVSRCAFACGAGSFHRSGADECPSRCCCRSHSTNGGGDLDEGRHERTRGEIPVLTEWRPFDFEVAAIVQRLLLVKDAVNGEAQFLLAGCFLFDDVCFERSRR